MAENQHHHQASFTIAEAARLYGKDRSTVFKHIKSQNGISARKERRGKRDNVTVIDLVELVRFYGEPPKQAANDEAALHSEDSEKGADIRLELALMGERLKAEKQLREQLEGERQREKAVIEAERDRALEQVEQWRVQMEHWQKQAEAQTRLLTDERERQAMPEKSKSFWHRLLG